MKLLFYIYILLRTFPCEGQTYMRSYSVDPFTVSGKSAISSTDVSAPQTIDTSFIRCTYNFTFVPNVKKPLIKSKDILFLDIGNRISKCYSQSVYIADTTTRKAMLLSNGKAYAVKQVANGDQASYVQTFKNYPSPGVMTVCERFGGFPKWKEQMGNIKWEIHTDTDTLLAHLCQKATTHFRGRDYIAWFTADIPISDGPWKFEGLPGLILKIADTNNEYVFECIGIEKVQHDIFITENYLESFFADPKKFYRLEKNYYKDPIGMLKMPQTKDYVIIVENEAGVELQPNSVTIPYNPIELEWPSEYKE